jgi:DNA-binding CsgD family transcriptional regulator/tetratricopeptide (TPR) repeat protein
MQRTWPLVGRQQELDVVLGAAGQPRRQAVVIAGRAGVGKTHLARAALDALAAGGDDASWVVGSRAAARIPFGALAPLLPPRGAAPAAVIDTMAEILQATAARARRAPVVLGVDDAHSLDDASAAVVHQLAASGSAVVVVTVRSGAAAPDAVTALWKDGVAERIELQPLAAADIAELLTAVLGAPVDEPGLAELVRASAGNCLFLRELVRAAREDGSLVPEGGRWRLRHAPRASGRLVELVGARMGELSAATRTVVELVAVGEPLALSAVERLGEPDALVDAEARELVVVDRSTRRATVRLAHPLYGEALRARLPALRARQHAAALAGDLAATGQRRADDELRLVAWQLDAGRPAAPAALLAAVRRALQGNDLDAAERFARAAVDAAVDATATATAGTGPVVGAGLALADVLVRRGRFADALAALDAHAAAAGPALDGDAAVDVAEARANLLFMAGRTIEAQDDLETAEKGRHRPADRARLRMARARLVNGMGRPRDALRLLDEAGAMAPGAPLEPWDLQVRGLALAFVGRFGEAEAVARRGLDPHLGHAGEVTVALEWAMSTLMLVAFGRGDLPGAVRLARVVLDDGLASRHRARRRAGAGVAGWALFQQGDVTRAIELSEEALDQRGGLETDGVRALAFGGLAGALALAGRLDEADATLARARCDERPPIRWFEHSLAVAEAHVAARRGLPSQARRILVDALDEAAGAGLAMPQLYLAVTATRVGMADLAVGRLRRLRDGDGVEGPAVGVLVDHAEAVLSGDAERLLGAADALERGGMVLAAAEATIAAAEAFAAAGRRGGRDPAERRRRALAARALARRRAERCPGADLSFLDRSGAPSKLTRREVEIARLAAVGHSSQAIAERLYVSVRTVDNHLSHAYLKLGITRRAELRHARLE